MFLDILNSVGTVVVQPEEVTEKGRFTGPEFPRSKRRSAPLGGFGLAYQLYWYKYTNIVQMVPSIEKLNVSNKITFFSKKNVCYFIILVQAKMGSHTGSEYTCIQTYKYIKKDIGKESWNLYSVCKTLWNFIGHSVLLEESLHRTKLISVWLWIYIVYIVLEATSDISVRLEMRQIGPITYLSCRSDGPMNLADTVYINSSPNIFLWQRKSSNDA